MADTDLALGIVGMAVFELAGLWQRTAPSISDLRDNPKSSMEYKQKLVDADVTVGLVTVLAAIAVAVIAKDWKVAVLLGLTFLVLTSYYHQILAAEPRQ